MDYRAVVPGLLAVALLTQAAPAEDGVGDLVQRVTRATQWRAVAAIPIKFQTFHPQGMVKVGDAFFVSSVDIKVPTKRFAAPQDGLDRDTGEGVGHLFKLDAEGNLLADLVLGEGSIYHPGGIDYDGRDIWVPVAEYRPNSRAIVYRVDPKTMSATAVLQVNDHIGGIVHDTGTGTLHGVSWGSRWLYKWPLVNGVVAPEVAAGRPRVTNHSHYIDYQDCHFVGASRMLCTGLNTYKPTADGPVFRLGGMELVDLATDRPLHQVPVELWAPSGLPMTQNPSWVEKTATGLRAYFMPDDDRSTLFVYEATVSF
jgi:hypothetical protein